jgi:hypothetical protein
MTLTTLTYAALFLVLGAGAGAVHWMGLRRNVTAYLGGGRVAPALALHLGRFVLTIAVFVAAAQLGAVPILTTLAGFLLSRYVVAGNARRAPKASEP